MSSKKETTIDRTGTVATAITIAPSIVKDPVATYLLSLQSRESRRTQRSALIVVAALFGSDDSHSIPWGEITYAHALALRDKLGTAYKPATAQRYFAAFRGVMREAWRLRILSSEEWQRIDDIDAPKGSSAETGRALAGSEIRHVFDACPNSYLGLRDAALFAVSVFAGLRRFETAGLQFADYDPESAELRVRGKGRKERVIRLAKMACVHLNAWIQLRGIEPGPLLYGRMRGRAIGYSTVDALLKRIAKRAKIEKFTPHDLRRTFVTRILEMTGDISIAQKAAGHAHPDTTVRYDKRKSEATKAATERLDEGL